MIVIVPLTQRQSILTAEGLHCISSLLLAMVTENSPLFTEQGTRPGILLWMGRVSMYTALTAFTCYNAILNLGITSPRLIEILSTGFLRSQATLPQIVWLQSSRTC
jgi:hypothetical protein